MKYIARLNVYLDGPDCDIALIESKLLDNEERLLDVVGDLLLTLNTVTQEDIVDLVPTDVRLTVDKGQGDVETA